MKGAMDFIGKALYAYSKGKSLPVYFLCEDGTKEKLNLGRYFKSYDRLTGLEKKLISLCSGRILDVGCATGYYVPYLTRRGEVTGIDISPHAIKVAKESGLDNCIVADIFKFDPPYKFNTITFLENNLGLGGSLSKTKQLLYKAKSMLANDGQILVAGYKVKKDTEKWKLIPQCGEVTGPAFNWISFNEHFLQKLCVKLELDAETITRNKTYYLIRITK